MKIGLSTYSLAAAIRAGEMTVLDAIQWIADSGGEHVELSPAGYTLLDNPALVEQVREKVASVGIEIASYTVPANFVQPDEPAYEAEITRILQQVDIGHKLGVSKMRHDAGSRPPGECTIDHFEADLPKVAAACQRIADYAAQFGITTSLENHGFHFQSSDRVRRLIQTVDRPNYRLTLDVGNFLCVDEDPVAAVKKSIGLASHVHIKDFFIRPARLNPGEGWFQTAGGHHLRGAIAGHGDMDLRSILKIVKESGYDSHLSVEFEGMEDCRTGSRIGMANVRRLLAEC